VGAHKTDGPMSGALSLSKPVVHGVRKPTCSASKRADSEVVFFLSVARPSGRNRPVLVFPNEVTVATPKPSLQVTVVALRAVLHRTWSAEAL
jgi:hypothetical protein